MSNVWNSGKKYEQQITNYDMFKQKHELHDTKTRNHDRLYLN